MKTIAKLFLILAGIIAVLTLWNIHSARSQDIRLQHLNAELNDIQDGLDTVSSTLATVELQARSRMMTVTMYTSRPQETDGSPCTAASNVDICKLHKAGVDTCASNDYRFGTRLTVNGLGTCLVLDRMNRRYTGKGRLDWYAGNDLAAATQFGIKTLTVETN